MGHELHNPELLEAALHAFTWTTGIQGHVIDFEPAIPGTPLNFRPDALIELQTQDKPLQFIVEVKRVDRHDILAQIRAFRPPDARPPLILIAPFITTQTAQRCRELRLFFIDAAGNAYIDEPGLYVYVTGQKRPAEFPVIKTGRLNNPAVLKVVFTFLCKPDLINRPYREIAAAAHVALGTVGMAIKELEARRHIGTFGAAVPKRTVVDPERLLKEWVEFYPATLRPKLRPRRFRALELEPFIKTDLGRYGAYWGGEVAAAHLTQYLRPETATIYTGQPLTKLAADNRLRADINGNVEILDTFWDADAIHHPPDLVPPLLVYADLVTTTDGRNLETARLLYEREIAPEIHRVK
jgi:hypothetical protein